jgi:hypothetical protein
VEDADRLLSLRNALNEVISPAQVPVSEGS